MIRRLWRDRRAATGVLVAAGLPMMLGFAAFAVDLGAAQLDARRLQGVADAAALAAASDPLHAQTAAQAVVDASGWPRALTVKTMPGRYYADAGRAAGERFLPGGDQLNAAQVRLTTQSPAYLMRALGITTTTVSRSATAARQRFAAMSIGSRLASLDGGLLNAYLSALTGSSVSLSLADYRVLADADIDLFSYLDAVHTRAGVSGGTYADTLAATVSAGTLVRAAADTSSGPAAAALQQLATLTSGSMSLNTLVDAGPLAGQATGGRGLARLNGLALVTALLQGASAQRQVTLDLGANVPSLGGAQVTLAIGDRPVGSPWVAIGDEKAPIVRTAQVRMLVEATLAPAPIAGIAAPVAIRAPLFVELASAEGRIAALSCPRGGGRAVDVEARTNPGQAAIAAIDPAAFNDFRSAPSFSPAKLITLPLVSVEGQARIDLGAAEPWQPLRFDQAAIDAGTMKTVSSSRPVGSIAQSLISKLSLTARVAGLPVSPGAIGQSVGGALAQVAPALDTLIGLATGALGVRVGEADVRVTGMRCGTPVLVG